MLPRKPMAQVIARRQIPLIRGLEVFANHVAGNPSWAIWEQLLDDEKRCAALTLAPLGNSHGIFSAVTPFDQNRVTQIYVEDSPDASYAHGKILRAYNVRGVAEFSDIFVGYRTE